MKTVLRIAVVLILAAAVLVVISCPNDDLLLAISQSDEDGSGDGNGEDTSETDTTSPTTSGSITFTAVQGTSFTVSWAAASDNATASEDLEYRGVYSTNAAAVQTKEATLSAFSEITMNDATRGKFTGSNLTSQALAGLAPDTEYHVNVVVLDEADTPNSVAYGAATQRTATTATAAPTVSGSISFSSVEGSSFVVNWPAASDDVTPAEDLEYQGVYSIDSADVVSKTATLGSFDSITLNDATKGKFGGKNFTSQTIAGLSPDTEYHVNIVVFDDDTPTPNSTDYGAAVQATAVVSDTAAPTVPGVISTSSVTATSFYASWDAASDNETAAADLEYRLVYSTDPSAVDSVSSTLTTFDAISSNTQTQGAFSGTNYTAQTVSGLTPETNYYLNVAVIDAASNVAEYGDKLQQTAADTTAPVVTGIISTSSSDTSTINLSWTAATDNATPQEQLVYRVVYSTNPDDVDSRNATLATFDSISTNDTTKGKFSGTNLTSQSIGALLGDTTYYMNVVVEDTAPTPNAAEYGDETQKTRRGPVLVVYDVENSTMVMQNTTTFLSDIIFQYGTPDTTTHEFEISNGGDMDLTISNWSIVDMDYPNAADWTIDSTVPTEAIAPSDTRQLIVRATQDAIGDDSGGATGDLTIESNDIDNPQFTFSTYVSVYFC